jgi:hypothetical protein
MLMVLIVGPTQEIVPASAKRWGGGSEKMPLAGDIRGVKGGPGCDPSTLRSDATWLCRPKTCHLSSLALRNPPMARAVGREVAGRPGGTDSPPVSGT